MVALGGRWLVCWEYQSATLTNFSRPSWLVCLAFLVSHTAFLT